MPYMKEHIDAGIKVNLLSEATTGRTSSYYGRLGSPRRGILRRFVPFTIVVELSHTDRPRQAQLVHEFMESRPGPLFALLNQ